MPFDDTSAPEGQLLELPRLGNKSAPVLIVLDPLVSPKPSSSPMRAADVDWLKPRILKYTGLSKDDVQFLSASPPIAPEDWSRDSAVTAILKKYEEAFVEKVHELGPKIIVPMGAKACKQIFGRSVKITQARGSVFADTKEFGSTPILPITSPFFARRHPESENLFCADLETLGRIVKADYDSGASHEEIELEFEWCFDIQHLIDNPPELLSVDIEGVGLDPFSEDSRILTVQLTHKKGHALCIPIDYDAGDCRHHKVLEWPKPSGKGSSSSPKIYNLYRKRILKQLRTLLGNKKVKVVGQNFKFDWLMLYIKEQVEVANYHGDTLLLAHLLDENLMSKSLADLVRIYVPEMAGYSDEFDRDPVHQGKTRMDLVPPDKMLEYGGGDSASAFILYNRLYKKLRKDKKLLQCYRNTVMRAMRAFCWVEQNGFEIDIDALKDFEKELSNVQKSETKWLLQQIPESIKKKHRDTGVGLKPDRSVILIDYLYNHPDGLRLKPMQYTKTGLPSVSTKTALPYYVADHEFVSRLCDYVKNKKMLSTYIIGFYQHIREGFIRPTFSLHTTVTGRSSSEKPNGQNFPKRGKLAKRFRKAFRAKDGWCYIQIDLSQAELRIAAMSSQDYNMMQVYKTGGDIHKSTAAGVMGIDVTEFSELEEAVQKLKRFQAKAVNFGFLYGMWWKKFREYAKTDYGIDFTDEQAEEIREMFFQTYPGLLDWHKAVEKFVRKHKYVRAFNGRIRHLPQVDSPDDAISREAVRQAINSPVQSIASDLGLMALGLLVPYLRKRKLDKHIKLCGFIHDSIICRVRVEYAAKAIRLIKRTMENLPLEKWYGWTPSVPIVADAEIGYDLADTYEVSPKHFSKASGNESFEEIETAYLKDELDGIEHKLAKGAKDKDEKAQLEKRRVEVRTRLYELTGSRVYRDRSSKGARSNHVHTSKSNRAAKPVASVKSTRYIRRKPTERTNAKSKAA